MCIGLAIGTAVGAATGNIGLWLPIGLALGLAFGPVIFPGSEDEDGNAPEDAEDKLAEEKEKE